MKSRESMTSPKTIEFSVIPAPNDTPKSKRSNCSDHLVGYCTYRKNINDQTLDARAENPISSVTCADLHSVVTVNQL